MQPAPLLTALFEFDRRLTAILMALRPVIARHFLHHPWVPAAITPPLWNRLGRYAARFSRLVAAFTAGRLCAPRAPSTRAPAPARPANRQPRPCFPRQHGWMLHALGHHAAVYRNQLERLLADPTTAELLAAAPGAGRILRPLCHMLGVRNASLGVRNASLGVRHASLGVRHASLDLPSPCAPPARPPRSKPVALGLSPRRPRLRTPPHPIIGQRQSRRSAQPA